MVCSSVAVLEVHVGVALILVEYVTFGHVGWLCVLCVENGDGWSITTLLRWATPGTALARCFLISSTPNGVTKVVR